MKILIDQAVIDQALEALEWNYNTDLDNIPACEQWAKMLKKNITALRQAKEQAQQAEPFGYLYVSDPWGAPEYHFSLDKKDGYNKPVYTSPPKREWQGLTDEEIDAWNIVGHESLREFVRAIEAKLKEKNNG